MNLSDTHSDNVQEREKLNREFIALFARYGSQIYSRVLAWVGSKDVADDVFQDVSLALWESFPRYDQNRRFISWASGVALNQTRLYFRSSKHRHLHFSDEVLQRIAHRMAGCEEILELRGEVLSDCLEQLKSEDLQILKDYYQSDEPVSSIASRLKRSAPSIYRRIAILKEKLFRCVDHTLKLGGDA